MPISFIGDNPFKFLGRKIVATLSETAQRLEMIRLLEKYFAIVDAQFLKGAAKAWLYNNYVIAVMA